MLQDAPTQPSELVDYLLGKLCAHSTELRDGIRFHYNTLHTDIYFMFGWDEECKNFVCDEPDILMGRCPSHLMIISNKKMLMIRSNLFDKLGPAKYIKIRDIYNQNGKGVSVYKYCQIF